MRFATRFASATLLVFFAACAPAPDSPAAKAAIPVPEKDKFEPKDSPAFDAAFWETWGDGSAELAAYDLTYTRYGRTRGGTAVTIFVSETFSSDARVKADSGKHPPRDEFPVMKLNLVQDFPTGIYDYNLMTSVFVSAKAANDLPAGTATKVSFSAQEWCGHVYMQALFDSHAARLTSHSYFDGEGDQQSAIEQSRDRLSEDALMHWARGMARPVLKPGESKRIEMLASLERARLTHKPLTNVLATLRRAAKPSMAGGIEVEIFEAEITPTNKWKFAVEKKEPRRIVQWETPSLAKAELIKSARLKYWELNQPEGQGYLQKLGLRPRPARTM